MLWQLTFFFFLMMTLVITISTTPSVKLIPKDRHALVNNIATFTCRSAEATVLNFAVAGTPVSDLPHDVWKVEEYISSNGDIKIMKLSIKALVGYNNSVIECFGNNAVLPASSNLIIQGPLANVRHLKAIFLHGSSVLLAWTPPYTLPDVPIIGYYIDITNTTVSSTNTIITLTDPDPCRLYIVSVSPVNGVGRGKPTYVTFQYHTVPKKSTRLVQFTVGSLNEIHGKLKFRKPITKPINFITIGNKRYERDDFVLSENNSSITIHKDISQNSRCFYLQFEDVAKGFISDIPSVDYQSQCINCTFYATGNTDIGCQVNLKANDIFDLSVQFIRQPRDSVSAEGCIPHTIDISCYDIYIFAIKNDGSRSDKPIQLLRRSRVYSDTCVKPTEKKCSFWICYVVSTVAFFASITVSAIIIIIYRNKVTRCFINLLNCCNRNK